MPLIAFRPEYQLTVDPLKNRIFHKVFREMQAAEALPFYLEDWGVALAEVGPRFTVLTDVTSLRQTNEALLATYIAAQQLIMSRGVAFVAEIHPPDSPVLGINETASGASKMPVRVFVDAWEADQFLDTLPGQ